MPKDTPLLMTPGPVMLPKHVQEALAKPPIHQRSAAFEILFKEIREGLAYLFQTEGDTLVLAGSGTVAMEATIRSLFSPGDKVVVQENGKFSARWLRFAESIRLNVVLLKADAGQAPQTSQLKEILENHEDLKGWILTHVETSTGAAIDLEQFAFKIREHRPNHLIVVDGICSVGIQALYMDGWSLDAVVAASQKGLQNPAGTSFVALSKNAVDHMFVTEADDAGQLSVYYSAATEKETFPFTPPVQLLYGIQAELRVLKAETLPRRWNRIHQLSRYFRSKVAEIGTAQFGIGNGAGLTVFESSDVADHARIREELMIQFGITIANGQGDLLGKILRIGHFGNLGIPETDACLKALKILMSK